VKDVEGCLIFNFASDQKVHFSLKIWRKTISKTAQRNTNAPGTPRRARGATSCAATSATRRTCRTHDGRARRGAGVTVCHCVAPARAHLCRPWQVVVPGGADPPAGAPPVARHWPPEWRTSPAMPRPLHACKWHRCDPTYPNRHPACL
jgi:hypothetical protein